MTNEAQTRVCNKCKRELPLTNEYFSWANKAQGRYQETCKACFSEYMHKRWVEIKKEDGDRLQKIKENRKRYVDKDPEREKERLRKKALKQYYENKEFRLSQAKTWRDNNKEHVREYVRKATAERYHNDPMYHMMLRSRNTLNTSFRRHGYVKSKKNIELTGMSSRDLYLYLLKTYEDTYGEPWNGVDKVHIDHIIPLSTAKNKEEIEKLCYYKNLRLLKAKDNLAKGSKIDYEIGA